MGKRRPTQMNSYSNKDDYVARLQEAGDTRPAKVKAQEKEIDQVFEPEVEEEEEGGTSFLRDFWNSLVD